MDTDKLTAGVAITVGGLLGSYVPVWFGASAFGAESILGSMVGSIVGIWLWFKFVRA